jgi:hypothetical protein
MSAPLYAIPASAVALTASTAKTVLGAKAHANSGLLLKKLRVSFNSVTAADQPPLIEICYCTWASNSPGTASTSVTPLQVLGRVITPGFTAGKTWTTEPTTLTPGDPIYIPPNGGAMYDVPLSDEWDCAVAEGFAIRVTPGASVTAMTFSGALYVSRC